MKKIFEEINKIEFLTKVKIRFNNIENGFENFKNNILSVYDVKLDAKEERTLLNKHRAQYEKKFIDFMNSAYEYNNEKGLIIDFYINNLDKEAIDKIMQSLTKDETKIFLEIIKKMSGDTIFLKILDKEMLEIIVKLNVREIFFSSFYFLDKELTIWGNYNMEFPVFYNDDFIIEEYIKRALEKDLYIR